MNKSFAKSFLDDSVNEIPIAVLFLKCFWWRFISAYLSPLAQNIDGSDNVRKALLEIFDGTSVKTNSDLLWEAE